MKPARIGLRALTLWPEWAWAITHLGKRCENRSWAPPRYLLGHRIAIHAGKSLGGRPGQEATNDAVLSIRTMLKRAEPDQTSSPYKVRDLVECTKSAIVATARLVSWDWEMKTGWDVPGEVHWRLDDVVVLKEPAPCKGRQGLWTVTAEILAPPKPKPKPRQQVLL